MARRTIIRKVHLFVSILIAALASIVVAAIGDAEEPVQRPTQNKSGSVLNNAHLMPAYRSDAQVPLEGISPDWVKTLIIAEFRIETATREGTFQSALQVLDHYQEMGVNGLWINPIYERGSRGNGYLSYGPHTIEPLLTGAANLDESFRIAKEFVDEAHRRNIRVFWDIVVWGTAKTSPLLQQHPEFYRKSGDKFVDVWGGYAFDWDNATFRDWYRNRAVELIEKTGADGFRVDLAPDTSGYFFKTVREELLKKDRKIAIVSELNSRRDGTFDFEQFGVHGWTEEPDYITPGVIDQQKKRFGLHHDYLLNNNIVEVIRSGRGIGKAQLQQAGTGGTYRFYTSNLLHHDDHHPFVLGSKLRIGYTGIFAPFIPMWWIGEEWNNPQVPLPGSDGVMFFNQIDWESKSQPDNRHFFEGVKQMIRIRRSYSDIFEYYPENHRESNIEAVKSTINGVNNPLQAYARYRDDRAIMIIPNADKSDAHRIAVQLDLEGLRLSTERSYRIVDLMSSSETKREVLHQYEQSNQSFEIEVPPSSIAVLLIEENR